MPLTQQRFVLRRSMSLKGSSPSVSVLGSGGDPARHWACCGGGHRTCRL